MSMVESSPEKGRVDSVEWQNFEEEDVTESGIQSIKTPKGDLKFVFLIKGSCLIYIGMSR